MKSNFYSCLTFFYALLNQLWICYLRFRVKKKKVFFVQVQQLAVGNSSINDVVQPHDLLLGNPKDTMILFCTSIKFNISLCHDSIFLGIKGLGAVRTDSMA